MRGMASDNILTFEGFKFRRTNFRFRNKKAMNSFFNEALIESPVKFLNLIDARTLEKMHILFSWMMIHRIAVYIWLILSFFSIYYHASNKIVIGIVVMALFSFIISKVLSKNLDNAAFGRSFFTSMGENDNFEFLEEVRQELIKEK
jgi:hypothetical protein